MVTYLSDDDGFLSTEDISINRDILIKDSSNKSRASITKQANDLLDKIPESDKSYKYIKQIAGKDKESIEKSQNPFNTKETGPSPRSARGLLDYCKGNPSKINADVQNFVESNARQLAVLESKGRQAIQQSK